MYINPYKNPFTTKPDPHIPYGYVAIGRCSLCGGTVISTLEYFGQPPSPRCTSCGARKQETNPYAHLPIIPMEKSLPQIPTCPSDYFKDIDWSRIGIENKERNKDYLNKLLDKPKE